MSLKFKLINYKSGRIFYYSGSNTDNYEEYGVELDLILNQLNKQNQHCTAYFLNNTSIGDNTMLKLRFPCSNIDETKFLIKSHYLSSFK